MLAAAGVTSVRVHARPAVTIFSTGDEVVPPDTQALKPGQVRDATAAALAALVDRRWRYPVLGGIVPDDPAALEKALRAALEASDVIVISAGSSVGARDETATAVARLGAPGIWCHGLAIKPGKPTLLAECGGIPVIGLPGNPRSALVVFRLHRDAAGPPGRRLHGTAAGAVGAGQALARPRVRDRAARRRPGQGQRRDRPRRCSACRRCCRC